MQKYRLFVILSIVCLSLSIIYSSVGISQAAIPKVELTTNPPMEKMLPFEAEAQHHKSPVTLTLQAVDASGKQLKNALISLLILTPPRNMWLTTDFPMVEGTKLLQMTAAAPDGKLEVQQILPIRGQYQLKVNVSPLVANEFSAYEQTLNLNVRENPLKFKYFAVVAAILLSVGLLGGWVIGGQGELREGEIAPQSVRLLLTALTVVAIITLIFINVSAEVAEAHGSGHAIPTGEIAPPIQQNQALAINLEADKNATVGKLANFSIQIKDSQTGKPINDVVLQLKAIALEHNLTVFSYTGVPNQQGTFTWLEQFFDGSPHKVEIVATPSPSATRQFAPLKVAQQVEVEGIAPPMYIRLIGLFYFTAIVGIGMVIGLLIQQKTTNREKLAAK